MGQTASCRFLEMWNGVSRREDVLLAAEVSEQMRPAFFPRCRLSDHVTPLFNYKTWTHSNMHLAFMWNLEYAKPSRSPLERSNRGSFPVCHESFKAFIPRTTKLELYLSAEISWNLTSLMQLCVSVPSTKFWENGNVKCPASAASCETRCLQINSEILVLNCLGAWLWRNH